MSLKSVAEKRRLKAAQQEKEKEAEHEAHEEFTEAQVVKAWEEYIQQLKKKGRKILASILSTDKPKVEETVIKIILPNQTMKTEVMHEQSALMEYIRQQVKNTHVTLEITVNREAEKKYAFTPQEKYEKLREKNPLVDKLRNTFELDL